MGDDKIFLMDTGCGVGSLRSYLAKITPRPVDIVILTHGHLDHEGGAGEFADVPIYLHPADRALMQRHNTAESRMEFIRKNNHIQPEPDDLTPQYQAEQTLPLEDGQLFLSGGLTIEIIHTPGHTQGMCMALFREERTILFGDGCGVNVMLLDEDASTVNAYQKTLLKVKRFEPFYDNIIRNHGSCASPKILLDNVIECCQSVINGTDDHIPVTGTPLGNSRAYVARAIKPGTIERLDGKDGNLVYCMEKVSG